VKIGLAVRPGRRIEKKIRTGQSKKVATVRTGTKICMPGNLADIITCAKFQDEIFKDYNFIGVKFPMYLLIFAIGPSLRGNTSFEPQSVKSVRFDLEKKGKKDSHCTDSNGGYLRRRHHVCKFQHEIFRDYNFTTSNFPYSLSWRFAIFAPSLWFFATKTVLL